MKSNDLKEAKQDKQQGDSALKTSCIFCKFKPDTLGAIPYYKAAIQKFNGLNEVDEQIYCHNKLVFCFIYDKSPEEEAYEHEALAKCYFSKKNKDAYHKSLEEICNATNAFNQSGNYSRGVQAMTKMTSLFSEENEENLAESCMKRTYENINKYFPVIVNKRDSSTSYVYQALYQYVGTMVRNNKLTEVVDDLTKFVSTAKEHEKNKKQISAVQSLILIMFILLDRPDSFNNYLLSAETEEFCDTDLINDIKDIQEAIYASDKKKYLNAIAGKIDFPNILLQRLELMYKTNESARNQQAEIINNEDDDGNISGDNKFVIQYKDEDDERDEDNAYL